MNDELFSAQDHTNKVRAKLFAHRAHDRNAIRGIRLDIPSASRGLEVVTIHERQSGGVVLGYDHSVTIEDVNFIVLPSGARTVGADGGNKYPFAFIGGIVTTEEPRRDGRVIYYDPRKVHLFVERETMLPVRGAAKVYQIGKTTYAQGLLFYEEHEAPSPPNGMNSLVRTAARV